MKETIRYTLVLGVICFLASSVLALVNSIASPKIELQREAEEKAALEEVMPEAKVFKPASKEGKVVYYSAYDDQGALKGFVLKTETKGYSSQIIAVAGLDKDLNITEVKVLSQNETPGLGNRIAEPDFLLQFQGKNLSSFSQIDAITGATISSSALINSLKDKILEFKDELLKEAKLGR